MIMALLTSVFICGIVVLTLSNCENMDSTSLNNCTSICLQKNLTFEHQQQCNDKCNRKPIKQNKQNRDMELICRDDTTLVVELESDVDGEQDNESQTFMVDINQIDKTKLPSKQIYLISKPFVSLENLMPNTSYNISASLLNQHYQHTKKKMYMEFQTLEVNYVPGNVTDIYTDDFLLSADGNGLDVIVYWDPSVDRTCSYELLFHSRDTDSNYGDETFEHIEFNQPEKLYRYELTDLVFGLEYAIGVRAFNTKNRTLQSSIWWHVIKTPSCLEWFHNNFTNCAPYQPANITVLVDQKSQNRYSLNISWENPLQHPDYYTIDIIDYESGLRQIFNVSLGSINSVQYDDIELFGSNFELTLTGHSSGGESSTIYRGKLDNSTYPHSLVEYSNWIIATFVCVPLLVIALLAVTKLKLDQRSRSIQKHNGEGGSITDVTRTFYDNEICSETEKIHALQLDFNFMNDDVMEIKPDRIKILEIIGEGAFGCVRRAILMPNEQNVAVKMLKNGPSNTDVRNFCREIEVMKSVPKHPHIVGIMGHCTKNIFQLMLLTEYCSEGNLLNFLRNIWKQQSMGETRKPYCLSSISPKHKSPEYTFNFDTSLTEKYPITYKKIHDGFLSPTMKQFTPNKTKEFFVMETSVSESPMIIVENHGYGFDIGNNHIDSPVTQKDLISFACQVANGMNFLSLNKVVHRDLACRNVLVCADRITVKISDFGLSRDIYQENLYKKSSSGILPIKWLAIESLTHQMYTSQSDVWSFGVLLYEIVTGGSVPYPSVETKEILNFLKSGGRMERPDECRADVYELMQMCWFDIPNERPTFKMIEEKLEQILNHVKLA